jgi:hypothetical protein
MNRKIQTITYICILITGLLAGGCSQGDTADVSIDLGLNKQARTEQSVIDRVLAFLSISTPAIAEPSPFGTIIALSITVTGPGMDVITKEFNYEENPLLFENGLVRITVPSGPGRLFAVKATVSGEGNSYYGGIKKINLPAGDVLLNISMGLLPAQIPGIVYPVRAGEMVFYNSISFYDYFNYYTEGIPVNGVIILRARGSLYSEAVLTPPADRFFNITGRFIYTDLGNTTYYDDAINPDYIYWYKFVPYNEYGAGEPSLDAVSDYIG